jgi:hypothetical protein
MHSKNIIHLISSQNCIDSLKLIGVLKRFNLQFVDKKSKDDNIDPTPMIMLYHSEQTTIPYFWNCIFYLDHLYWNDKLQFSPAAGKEQLFKLIEECDLRLFPTILTNNNYTGQHTDKSDFFITKLLQWQFTTAKRRKKLSIRYKEKSYNIGGLTLEGAFNRLNEILLISMPALHKEILAGCIYGFLESLDSALLAASVLPISTAGTPATIAPAGTSALTSA